MVGTRPRLRVAERRYMDITARGLQQGCPRQGASGEWRGRGLRRVLSGSHIVGSGGQGIVIDAGGRE